MSADDLTTFERALIVAAHEFGPFEASLIQADSRDVLASALDVITPQDLVDWEVELASRPPFGDVPSPGAVPRWALSLIDAPQDLNIVGGWMLFCSQEITARVRARLAKELGEDAMAVVESTHLEEQASYACKSVISRIGAADLKAVGVAGVFLACGVRWRDALLVERPELSRLITICCRQRYAAVAPALRAGQNTLSEGLGWGSS